MNYIGIDCSSKAIHLTLLDNQGRLLGFFSISSNAKTLDARLFELVEGFDRIIYGLNGKDSLAAIEKAIYRQNPITTMAIAQVIAGVKLILRKYGIEQYNVDNKTWKKQVVGKGNSTKEEIKVFAIEKWNLEDNLDQDSYDAICIGYWGYLQEEQKNEIT